MREGLSVTADIEFRCDLGRARSNKKPATLPTRGAEARVADFEDGSIPRYCLRPGCRGVVCRLFCSANISESSGRASRQTGVVGMGLKAPAESTGSHQRFPATSPPGHGGFACTSLRRL